MSKLRVALVAPSLRYVGGQSVQASLLLRYWKNDPEVEVKFVPVDPLPGKFLRWVLQVRFMRTVVREPLYLLNLYRELRDVDVVHAFSASYSSFLLAPVPALLIGQRLGKRVLINYRSGEAEDHFLRSRIATRLLAAADARVVPSGYLRRIFLDFGLKTEVIPNIIDGEQFRYRDRYPIRPRLICSRGFHPYYRPDLVVRAFRLVKDTFPEATLTMLGSGPTEVGTRNLVNQLNLQDVEFPGAVSRQDIGRFYDSTDIFVNASNVDNMPVSILEAYGAGTPVVSTAPEGIRYIVEHERTGLLCKLDDYQALAANVVRLLRNPDLARKLAQQGRLEARRYQWQSIRPEWLKLYRSLSPTERIAQRD